MIDDILSKLETADNSTKNELENILVTVGERMLAQLVDRLQVVKGVKRGIVAMTLIRIGGPSVAHLQKAAQDNKDFEWIAQYLIREIAA
jgi:hypothetical protein